jgi:glycerophosphoryl diester phosphodiesterase
VIAVARAHGRRVAIHSFDHACMARIARLAPDIPRGILLDHGTPDSVAVMQRAVSDTGARDVWPHRTLVSADLMEAARTIGVRVLPWTVNDADDARRLAALGVDGMCTDDVRLLATV